jgi:hypothetical protein
MTVIIIDFRGGVFLGEKRMMIGWFRLAFTALASMLVVFTAASAADEFFMVEDLKPGMRGIGKTCYQGSEPEEFQVEILGVLHGVNPGASVVLAKFSGERIEKTGVFEGMSGSPIFIDGKLLGAVAYSFTFAKEAIGGINPITQMVEAFNGSDNPSSGIPIILKRSRLWNYRLPLPAARSDSAELPVVPNAPGRQSSLAALGGHSLVPIATPLNMGGFHAEVLKTFAPQFRAMGMSFVQGVGSVNASISNTGEQDVDAPAFRPGSNIIVPLVRGDLDVSAGGTVTYVDGDRLYAFGHSMFELGFTELPMHKARTIAVFPSLESSFKILEMGESAGSIRQDRGMGIYGIVGQKPQMVLLRIHLTTSRGDRREFNFELAKDPLLTPVLVNLTVYNTIVASERAQGIVTLNVQGTIHIKDEQPVEVANRFSSDSDAPSSASLSVAVPVNYLMSPGYENLDLQNIDLEISVEESDRLAILDSVRFDQTEIKAGESVKVEIFCKKANGTAIRNSYPVTIPENASPGKLTALVADGSTLMSLDQLEEGEELIPRDLTQLIKMINNLRKNDRLYLRFFRREPGTVLRGEGLPGLPPSILSILESDRKAGAMNSIYTSTLREYELPATDNMIMGAKALTLTIKP